MHALPWWQKAVFYQIYPRSFADGNGDGIGDVAGMVERLDYLSSLGVDALWLSPHYPSPQADCGYDISDYTGVAPEYGTLDDFVRLLEGAHARGIRVILDLVLNHTSDQHPWFVESRSSRDNPRRNWFVWRDPAPDGGPPSNWESVFGGSAWEYDPATGQYYYHQFLKEQPDLNWRNPEVKQAMFDMVRFWLDLGVDGFRLDAIGSIFEHPDLPDHTSPMGLADLYKAWAAAQTDAEHAALAENWKLLFQYQFDQPGVHELMQELRRVVDEYPDRMLVGEDDNVAYHGNGDDELHLVFNFPLMRTRRLTPQWVRANQQLRLSALPHAAWPCNTLGNHDSPRVYSRYGDGVHDAALARISAALMLTLRGTPFLYNGEEIGMRDLVLDDLDQFRDTAAVRTYHMAIDLLGMAPEVALRTAAEMSRDRCRTPMQWDATANAGFSPAGVRTWLPVNPNYAQGVNVAAQEHDPDSLLHFYRQLIAVRKQTPALIAGAYLPLAEDHDAYLAFVRRSVAPDQACLVLLNMSEQPQMVHLALQARHLRLLFSSHPRAGTVDDPSGLPLAPFEVYIAEILT